VTALSVIWGGTEITTTRIVLAVVAEILIVAYLAFALRLFGR
jgi:hypothetical protein